MAGGEGMGWKGTLGIALFVPAVVGLVVGTDEDVTFTVTP